MKKLGLELIEENVLFEIRGDLTEEVEMTKEEFLSIDEEEKTIIMEEEIHSIGWHSDYRNAIDDFCTDMVGWIDEWQEQMSQLIVLETDIKRTISEWDIIPNEIEKKKIYSKILGTDNSGDPLFVWKKVEDEIIEIDKEEVAEALYELFFDGHYYSTREELEDKAKEIAKRLKVTYEDNNIGDYTLVIEQMADGDWEVTEIIDEE